jgi:hypothetical protein
MIPGINLYSMATSVIGVQSIAHKAFVSRATNAAGYDVPTYATAATITGSMQAVPRTLYQEMGLDLAKNYANLYTSAVIKDVQRNGSGDLVVWNGKTWQCESQTDWSAQDGWRSVLCVEVPA